MIGIDRESKIPLYKQLKKCLLQDIYKNMNEGDLLPNEAKIEEQFNVSRITVRNAIDELVSEGIVMKQQGRGTFVRSKKIVQDANRITSWTEEMRLKGKNSKTEGLEVREISPSKKLIEKLGLSHNEKVICLKRIRYIDGEPMALMINYLREKYIPGFLDKKFDGESLYEELEQRYNIIFEEANENIKARLATDLEAMALNVSPDTAVLHITRVSYLGDGIPMELVEMICRADRYEYQIQLSGRYKNRVIDEGRI